MIEIEASNIGIDNLDARIVREANIARWRAATSGAVGADALRSMFQSAVAETLSELSLLRPAPVVGEDVMSTFDIGPGPTVGVLLRMAKRLWEEEDGLGREELLERVRKQAVAEGILG